MNLHNHVWGRSRAMDRLWAQVTGLRPASAQKRLLMVFQAFIDDSYSGGAYVLAGHIASAEAWADFSKEWEYLLPLAPLDGRGRRSFKMKQMHNSANLIAFYRVMERHVACSISFYFNICDFKRAKERVKIPGSQINWGEFNSNFMFAFSHLMGAFHLDFDNISRLAGFKEPIDFIFDNQSEKRHIYAGWDEYINNRSDKIRSRFGASPRFEDDQVFLPLQAADFFAWYVRSCLECGLKPGERKLFGWEIKRIWPYIDITMNEDSMVRHLAQSLRLQSGKDVVIYDSPPDGRT